MKLSIAFQIMSASALATVASSTSTIGDYCPSQMNLGPLFSASTGFTDTFPILADTNLQNPRGRESEIGFLVGGNYNAPLAAEIEGNAVVLGDFIIGPSGTNSIGHAGIGSGIYPIEDTVVLRIGGDLDGGRTNSDATSTNYQDTWIMTRGSVEYGGQCLSDPANAMVGRPDIEFVMPDELACGSFFVPTEGTLTNTVLDTYVWNQAFDDLQVKSEFWYNLPVNGVFTPVSGSEEGNTLKLEAGDDACLQVFFFEQSDLDNSFVYNVRLDSSLSGKTILININPYDANGELGEVTVNKIGKFFDTSNNYDCFERFEPSGTCEYNGIGFSPAVKASMLWNFYGATKVTLGPDGGPQFPGSVLIPSGGLDMLWPGQDGRLIVKGDVLHNDDGSEFHNYEFDPPCPLPLPDVVLPPECQPPPEDDECPYQYLNFTEITNPAADYYRQASTFEAGDYLFDQLWYSLGVKVSSRVIKTDHKTASDPFMPLYDREQNKWVQSKTNHDPEDPFTGSAIRLFDTARPTASTNAKFNQQLCSGNNGDPDLGAPNRECPGEGPGRGKEIGNTGIFTGGPTNVDGTVNPYANCEPLGLVGIIQESDMTCPDDTARGGYITFQFREPVPLKLASLLDTDDRNTPEITIYYGNGQTQTIVTDATGDNGFYDTGNAIDPDVFNDVTMVDIKYSGSGSINSLQYRYCPKQVEPKIEIKKYAGPVGGCEEKDISAMEDDTYTVPSESAEWQYCYVVSVPETTGECLYDVEMKDPAAIGGIGETPFEVIGPNEVLCAGDVVYIPGPVKTGEDAPEESIEATVEGTGKWSGQSVDDSDPAEVVVETTQAPSDPTPAPTDPTPAPVEPQASPAPTPSENIPEPECPYPEPGFTDCPSDVTLLTEQDTEFDAASPINILSQDGDTVTFNISNPFDSTVTSMFYQYEGTNHGAAECLKESNFAVCAPVTVTVDCIAGRNRDHTLADNRALVSIWFVDNDVVSNQDSASIPECCHPDDNDADENTVVYTYKLFCDSQCPTTEARRVLRGSLN